MPSIKPVVPALLPDEIITTTGNQLRTSSIHVANVFGKMHKEVLRRISSLDCSKDFNERNFTPVEYLDGKGEKRPAYEMTKDGFVFLVMGFTGKKASRFKEAYINAFNEMEAQLKLQTLNDQQAESPFDRIDPRLISELRRVSPQVVQAYLVDRGITPELVNGLVSRQPLITATVPGILPISELNGYLEKNGLPYGDGRKFLFSESLEKLLKDYDRNATLRHFRNAGILWSENDRLARKLSTNTANLYSNGVRVRVFVFNQVNEG